MISQAGDKRRSGRFAIAALALSLAFHALLAVLAPWLWSAHPVPAVMPRETVVSSTAIRIEHRIVPQPRAKPVSRTAVPSQPKETAALPRREAPVRHELARPAPTAPPQRSPQPSAPRAANAVSAAALAQQQGGFEREVARLRAQSNPLSAADKTAQPPQAFHRSYFDVVGHRDYETVQTYLVPLKHWYAGSTICYYTRYTAQYRSGGSEEGTIPWPICYPIGADRIAYPRYVHELPVPIPPPDYVLPPGTYLSPLLAQIYQSRTVSH